MNDSECDCTPSPLSSRLSGPLSDPLRTSVGCCNALSFFCFVLIFVLKCDTIPTVVVTQRWLWPFAFVLLFFCSLKSSLRFVCDSMANANVYRDKANPWICFLFSVESELVFWSAPPSTPSPAATLCLCPCHVFRRPYCFQSHHLFISNFMTPLLCSSVCALISIDRLRERFQCWIYWLVARHATTEATVMWRHTARCISRSMYFITFCRNLTVYHA